MVYVGVSKGFGDDWPSGIFSLSVYESYVELISKSNGVVVLHWQRYSVTHYLRHLFTACHYDHVVAMAVCVT